MNLPWPKRAAPADDTRVRMSRIARRESMRAEALHRLLEAIRGRDIAEGENSLMVALELAGTLKRDLDGFPRGRAVESIREAALRRLLSTLLDRPLAPDETAVSVAVRLADDPRLRGAAVGPGDDATEEPGTDDRAADERGADLFDLAGLAVVILAAGFALYLLTMAVPVVFGAVGALFRWLS